MMRALLSLAIAFAIVLFVVYAADACSERVGEARGSAPLVCRFTAAPGGVSGQKRAPHGLETVYRFRRPRRAPAARGCPTGRGC